MNLSTIIRHFREGFLNVFRNGWMTFASISSIFISLLILGFFLLVTMNLNNLSSKIESQVEIKVFFQVDVTEQTRNEIQEKIAQLPNVKKVTFISKEQGLEQIKNDLGEDGASLLEDYEGTNNPLPDALTIEINKPNKVEQTVQLIDDLGASYDTNPIMDRNYGQGTVEKLFQFTELIRNFGLLIVAGLSVTAIFLIATTIKTTIEARRNEISIMKLVGATNQFIRWPFFIEGALIGFIGSALTTIVLLISNSIVLDYFHIELGILVIDLLSTKEVYLTLTGLLVGLGTIIGIWGSILSIRKHLKV